MCAYQKLCLLFPKEFWELFFLYSHHYAFHSFSFPLHQRHTSFPFSTTPSSHTHTHTHTHIFIFIFIHTMSIELEPASQLSFRSTHCILWHNHSRVITLHANKTHAMNRRCHLINLDRTPDRVHQGISHHSQPHPAAHRLQSQDHSPQAVLCPTQLWTCRTRRGTGSPR